MIKNIQHMAFNTHVMLLFLFCIHRHAHPAEAPTDTIHVSYREWRDAYCADQPDQQHVRPLLKMDRRVYVLGRPIEAIVGFEAIDDKSFVDELCNPFLEPQWPVHVLLVVFDSEKRFLGAVRPRGSIQTEMPSVKAWQSPKDANAVGRRIVLSDNATVTKILSKPGEYSLQVIADWRAFSRRPYPEDPKFFQKQQRQWTSPAAGREMARSTIITIRLIEGDVATSQPQGRESLFVSQIVFPPSERVEIDQPFRLEISAENVSDAELYLVDPLNRLGRYWAFPRNHLILSSMNEPEKQVDLSQCEWCKAWPAYMPARLPAGCWMGARITVTSKWKYAGSYKLQLIHDQDVFASKEAAERMANGDNSLLVKSTADKTAPRIDVKSNILKFVVPEAMPE